MPEKSVNHGTEKKLSLLFCLIAVILSDVMCAAVAYQYCDLLWKTKYFMTSAPADTAFLLIIPFAAGILFFGILSVIYDRKSKQVSKE